MPDKHVIQCPACQARFAVGLETFKSIQNPTFQCSRCSTMFNLEIEPPTVEPEEVHAASSIEECVADSSEEEQTIDYEQEKYDAPAPAPAPALDSGEQLSFLTTPQEIEFSEPEPAFQEVEEEELVLDEVEYPSASAEELNEEFLQEEPYWAVSDINEETTLSSVETRHSAYLDEEPELPIVTADWPGASDSREVLEADVGAALISQLAEEEDPSLTCSSFLDYKSQRESQEECEQDTLFSKWRKNDLAKLSSQPLEECENHDASSLEQKEVFDDEDFSLGDEPPQSAKIVPFPAREKSDAKVFTDKLISSAESIDSEALFFDDEMEPIERIGVAASERYLSGKASSSRSFISRAWRSCSQVSPMLFICSVPLVCALGFWFLGQKVVETPQVSRNVFALVESDHAVAPPAELEMVGLRSKVVTLDDGAQVLDIQGKLVNKSALALEDIQIEARLYDENNQAIKTILVDARNGLLNASQIRSLKKGMIDSLQEEPALGDKVLKSQAESQLRIIFSQAVEDADWFSARVYSVKKI